MDRKTDITQWHSWFAWLPVLSIEGDHVWLQYVLRKNDAEDAAVIEWIYSTRWFTPKDIYDKGYRIY